MRIKLPNIGRIERHVIITGFNRTKQHILIQYDIEVRLKGVEIRTPGLSYLLNSFNYEGLSKEEIINKVFEEYE